VAATARRYLSIASGSTTPHGGSLPGLTAWSTVEGRELVWDGAQWISASVASVTTSTGAADAGKLVALGPTGLVNVNMLPLAASDSTVGVNAVTTNGSNTGTGQTAARIDHTHYHGDLGGYGTAGWLHAPASAAAHGFMTPAQFNKLQNSVSAYVGAADAGKLLHLDANGAISSNFLYAASGSAPGIITAAQYNKITNTVSVSAGAGDAGKLLALNGSGKVDATCLPATAASTATSVGAADAGKLVQLNSSGAIDNTILGAVSTATGASSAWKPTMTDNTGRLGNGLLNWAGASGGAADAAKVVITDYQGKIDPSFLSAASASAQGAMSIAHFNAINNAIATTAGVADAGKLLKLDVTTGKLDAAVLWNSTTSSDAGVAYVVKLNSSARIDPTLMTTATASVQGAMPAAHFNLVNTPIVTASGVAATDKSRLVQTDANGKIDSNLLWLATTSTTPAGVGLNWVPKLNASGKLDATFLPTAAATTTTSVGAADSGKVTALNASGQLDNSFLNLRQPAITPQTTLASSTAADRVMLYSIAGARYLTVVPQAGLTASGFRDQQSYQPAEFSVRARSWQAIPGVTTGAGYGMTVTTIGTGGTARTLSLGQTNRQSSSIRIGYVCGAAAGSSAGLRENNANAIAGGGDGASDYVAGGFFFIARVSFPVAMTGARAFIGLHNLTPSNADPSTWAAHCLGWLMDAADGSFRFCSRGYTGLVDQTLSAPARTSLHTPANVYEFACWLPRGGTNFGTVGGAYRAVDGMWSVQNSGPLAAGYYPTPGTGLYPMVWINNGTTTTQHAVDIHYIYIETDL
jgi:hypothetical protein